MSDSPITNRKDDALPPDFEALASVEACLLYLESPPPPPLQLPSTPVHTHQPPDSQQTAAGAALLSESKACALLNVTVSRGRFSFAKELILEWKWRALTKLSLDGQRSMYDVGGILACFKVLRESGVCFCLSEFEARNYESSSFGPSSAIAILKNLPVERSRMRCLKLEQFAVSDEVIEFCCQQFPSLTCLDVSNNEMVYNVPAAVQLLTGLSTLNLSKCINLVSLPDELLELRTTLTTVSCQFCSSVKFPPASICTKGKDEIFKFLSAAASAKPLKRVKVMFLGNGRCGKTSLLRALAHEPLKAGDVGPGSTIGVSMDTLEKKLKPGFLDKSLGLVPKISYWDFAGQLEYSAAHDFFLSSRQAVYVIVFSVVDDRDSQIHQVAYWLRTVSTRASQHVRFIMVGTKVDRLSGTWKEVEARLESIRVDIRNVVANCRGVASLESTSVLFVTSLGAHPQYKRLRKEFKKCVKSMCKSIFRGDSLLLKMLRFPEEYRLFQGDIQKLNRLRSGLPILELESVQGQEYGRLQGAHINAQSLQALKVLHDVGDIVFCHISDGKNSSKACLCWKPQVIADIIAKFADPDASLPIRRGCSSRKNLEVVLEQYLQCSPYRPSSEQKLKSDVKMLFNFLFALRIFATIQRHVSVDGELPADDSVAVEDDDSAEYMVPASLQGRPSFWREVFSSHGLSFSCIRGTRYSCMDSMITVAAFVRAMTQLCSNPARMWGCAFSIPISNGAFIFVRLAESRGFVDVIVLGSDLSQLVGDCVENSCLEILMLLRCSTSDSFLLCPHCCASDMFPRSGAAHAFHKQQLVVTGMVDQHRNTKRLASDLHEPVISDQSAFDRSGARDAHSHFTSGMQRPNVAGSSRMISCSRYHEVSESSVLMGQHVGSVGGSGMPVSFPASDESGRESLDWVSVSNTGLAVVDAGKVAVMPNSFFSLTRQLSSGDILSEEALVVIRDALESGAKTCRVQRCDSGDSGASSHVDLRLEYSVGDSIGSHVIDTIMSCSGAVDIKTTIAEHGVVITKKPHNLSCGDKVMLSVQKDYDGRKVEGVLCLVTDVIKDDHLILMRAPAPTVSDSELWTGWDAHPASHLPSSHLPLSADLSFMPVRASFSPKDDVLVVYKRPDATQRRPPFEVFPGSSNRLRIARLLPSDCCRVAEAAHWRDVEDNWAIMLGNEFYNYEITRITLFRCEERERLFIDELDHLKQIAPTRSPAVFDCVLDKNDSDRANRAVLQQRVISHFREFSQKFCLLPDSEGKDVNLCVAWWGKWSAVYHNVAQNGFWNLPPHLKLDSGFFGEGFYLTRYPRYSDYYVNGCSLSTRKMEHGSILMCYAALGRPYPVTQDPLKPPNYREIDPQSLCGKPCGVACGFSSSGGVHSHDCHYVTVKMHSDSGQYFPCPVRQQPDYDEIVVFNPNRILASAYVDFQRRRKTLIWLDDNPNDDVNTRIRLSIPGHGSTHNLEGLNEGRLALNADNTGIPLEDQVDVILFTTVEALDAYLCHPNQLKFVKYPTSLFRIVTNRRLYVGPDGLLSRMTRNPLWCSAFPATLVLYTALRRSCLEEDVCRPNLLICRSEAVFRSFVSFRSAELLVQRAIDDPVAHQKFALRVQNFDRAQIATDDVDPQLSQSFTIDQAELDASISTDADAEVSRQVFLSRTLPEFCCHLKNAKFDAIDLKFCGFEALTLRLAGFDAAALKLGGYDYFALKEAGFSREELNDAGFVPEAEFQVAALQRIADEFRHGKW